MTPAADGTARVEFQVRFSRGPKGQRRVREAKPEPSAPEAGLKPVPDQVPKITRLLVLGHHFERLVRNGIVKDYAEIARLTGNQVRRRGCASRRSEEIDRGSRAVMRRARPAPLGQEVASPERAP